MIRSLLAVSFFLLCLASTASPPTLNVPEIKIIPKIDGKLDDAVWKDIPWNKSFLTLRDRKPAQAETRFKIAHDSSYLYFAVEAFEPYMDRLSDMPELRKTSESFWLNDSIEINLVTDPRLEAFHKLIVSSAGRFQEIEMIDDNTGKNRYTAFHHWNSHAQVKTFRGRDRWTVEAAIPYGALNFDSSGKLLWRINVNRNRHTVKPAELSSFSPISGVFTNAPQEFAYVVLSAFRPKEYFWSMGQVSEKISKEQGKGLVCNVAADILNRTGRFRIAHAVFSLLDGTGRKIEKSAEFSLADMKFMRLALPIAPLEEGAYTLNIALYSSTGTLLKNMMKELRIAYQPITIRLLRPAYRDNVYATMPDKTAEAEITLDSISADTLIAELKKDGKVISRRQAKLKNGICRVLFEMSELPDGEYFLHATTPDGVSAKQRIRKLPYLKGEVWLDQNGITHVDGKRFLPVGWLIFLPEHGDKVEKGFNSHLSYNIGFPDFASFAKFCSTYEKHGLKTVIFPFQEFSGEHAWKIFTHDTRSGSVTNAQRKQLEKTIPQMRGNPGILAWYLADEPESRGNNNPQWFAQIKKLLEELDPYHPTILLNWGVNGMRQFYEGCDILMPDCYFQYFEDGTTTKTRWATSEYMKNAIALKRPAWLVPQAFSWPDISKDGARRGVPPSFDELRAEFYQALIHNCKGFQLYNYPESRLFASLIFAPRAIAQEIQSISGLLLENSIPNGVAVKTFPDARHFQAGLKIYNDETCIIAVNTLMKEVKADFTLSRDIKGKLYVAGEKRSVNVVDRRFTDTFGPGITHVYLTNRANAEKIASLDSIRKKIADYRRQRKKTGNLIGIGERLTQEYLDFQSGKRPADIPEMTASSDQTSWFSAKTGSLYYLLDGVTDDAAYFMTWSPESGDASPWIQIQFSRKKRIRRVKLYTLCDKKGKPRLDSAEIMIKDKNGFRKMAEISKNAERIIEVSFPETETDIIRIENIRVNPDVNARTLTEIEVY